MSQLLHLEPPRKGPKSLFELAVLQRECGIGMRFTRKNWRSDNCYWRLTRVKLKVAPEKFSETSPHGKAWGVLTWKGKTDGREREVRSPYKRQWSHYEPLTVGWDQQNEAS